VSWLRCFFLAVCGVLTLAAETIHFKTRNLEPQADPTEYLASPLKRRAPGSSHYLIQFDGPVRPQTLGWLRKHGITVTGYVPDATLIIAAPDDFSLAGLPVRWIGRLEHRDKISPLVTEAGAHAGGGYIVEFHPDVDMQEARALVREHGLRLSANPDLAPHHLLVTGAFGDLSRLASWDEVAYIFPASRELMSHIHVRACAGAVVGSGTVGQVAGSGYRWPLNSPNGLVLSYVFSHLTEKLPPADTQSEILRAFHAWSQVTNAGFISGSDSQAPYTVNILFASGAHGDPYPFDGPGGILAHTFYPAPPNPEPIAGDMHLDNDERWQIGANTDVYSVVLHEAGHALGLVHTDNPFDVMYPYYRLGKQLSSGDIATVQALYGAPAGSTPTQPTPPPPAPLVLSVQAPVATTIASSISISGTTSGGAGPAQITWVTSAAQAGIAAGSASWTIAAVPLGLGANTITITAADTANHTAVQSVWVTRQQPPPPPPSNPPPPPSNPPPPGSPTDTTPPSLVITYPASTILATTATTITFQGMATDNVGVTSVTWTNSTGSSGVATGAVTWLAKAIPLVPGSNVITVKAFDAAGNIAWRSVTVVKN
jgi:hypothetical protein